MRWLLLLAVACADLEPLPAGECDNGVLDPDEDCDTHHDPALGAATRCDATMRFCMVIRARQPQPVSLRLPVRERRCR